MEEYLLNKCGVCDPLASWLAGMCGLDGRGDSLVDTSRWAPDS